MKWYSIKKYTPWSDDDVIARIEIHETEVEDRDIPPELLTMQCWYCHIEKKWFDCIGGVPLAEYWKVTHFCQIPPVEIED